MNVRESKNFFLFVGLFLVCFSSFVSAEPPIEVIYWKSSDVKSPSQNELDSIHEVMVEVQSFFASEMDRHGFGLKTFDFNSEITVIDGKLKLHQYMSSHWEIVNESLLIERGWQNQIWVVFWGGASHVRPGANALSQRLCQVNPQQEKYCNNLVLIPAAASDYHLPLVAHEIGHAFGINDHSPERFYLCWVDIMYFPLAVIPGVKEKLKNYAFNQEHAILLNEGERLSIQQDSDQDIVLDTDVNNDGYTDLYDCLIVRAGMSAETVYDTDINNDGITNILDLMLVKAAAFEAIAAAAPSKRRVKITTLGALKNSKF